MEAATKQSSPQSKYYAKRMKEDELFYERERARLRGYKVLRYKTDPEFRQHVIDKAKESYYRRKEAKLQQATP